MEVFQVVQFEQNYVGDDACNKIFHKSSQNSKNKNKFIKTVKVLKRSNDSKNTITNKRKIKNVLNSVGGNVISKHSDNRTITPKHNKNLKKASNNRRNSEEVARTFARKVPLRKNNIKNYNRSAAKTEEIAKFSKENQQQQKHRKERSIGKSTNTPPVELDECANTSIMSSNKKLDYKQRKQEKLKEKLQQTVEIHIPSSKQKQTKSLREKMMEKLQAARFRYINEQIYSSDGKNAQKFFSNDPESFRAYHEGYKQQVNKWPLNPVNVIIKSIQKMPKTLVIADFGCGDATLAKSIENTVYSFDLVATNELVTACDMAHVPLQSNSVDVVVFCLSLMGTNLHDYILEANRVLKMGGILKIAEVESRFGDVQQFIEGLSKFNFKNTWKDLSQNLFYFLDFRKESNIKKKKKLPTISLNPCLYKKR